MMLKKFRLIALVMLPFFAKCQSVGPGPKDYDLDKPGVVELAKELKEISGIVVREGSIYAITDDKGKLYQLDKRSGKILAEWTFAKDDDYEDVALVGNTFFVLNSNGDIFAFDSPAGSGAIEAKKFAFPFGKGVEFEILYYDESKKKLVMICKECKDDGNKTVTVYAIDPQSGKYEKAGFKIDASEVAKKANSETGRLKPSAAAIHPLTGEVFLVSSINKVLIRMDREGRIKTVQQLKRSDFEQPEGIAFLPNGDMLISNEAGNNKKANILFFNYQ